MSMQTSISKWEQLTNLYHMRPKIFYLDGPGCVRRIIQSDGGEAWS